LRSSAPAFLVAVDDQTGQVTQQGLTLPSCEKSLDLHVNEMLQKQVIRFFPSELESRVAEVAEEIWGMFQKQEEGCLGRLRSFFVQLKARGTMGGTLLMLAFEQGLVDMVDDLLKRLADPYSTMKTKFGSGASALQIAAGQGHAEVVDRLLRESSWTGALCSDALGKTLEQGLSDCLACAQRILEVPGTLEHQNYIGLSPLLTAVQTGNLEGVRMLLERGADIEALTERPGIKVQGAGRAKVNGPFQEVGSMNERPLYMNGYGAVLYCDSWWKIAESKEAAESEEGGKHLYSMPAPHHKSSEPTLGQWTTDGHRAVAGEVFFEGVDQRGGGEEGLICERERQCMSFFFVGRGTLWGKLTHGRFKEQRGSAEGEQSAPKPMPHTVSHLGLVCSDLIDVDLFCPTLVIYIRRPCLSVSLC